jgi:transcriptional regulator with XRE-family HTH domain
VDRQQLGEFLRSRRERLRPEDVGLIGGGRRRTPGLRRDEVALLANMSTDYYERIEQGRGPQPSEAMLGGIARALRLTLEERDHLYLLGGRQAPPAHVPASWADPGLMTILDALAPTVPALITDELSAVVAQNAMNVALLGPLADRGAQEGNFLWHWFTDPAYSVLYAENDRRALGRTYVAELRAGMARRQGDRAALALVDRLLEASEEFRELWALQEVAAANRSTRKVLQHPVVGRLDCLCDVVVSPPSGQRLVLFRGSPGTDAAEKLALLSVIGSQDLAAEAPRAQQGS